MVQPGETITITADVENSGERVSVVFVVDGQRTTPSVGATTSSWSVRYTVPRASSSFGQFVSTVPPHVFTGTANLGGAPAPDGTVVAAWIHGTGGGSTLKIEVTATNADGNTGFASRQVSVGPGSTKVVETTVSGGSYTLLVAQPPGESFGGKNITFTIGGKGARQTPAWQQGGADILNLNSP